MGEKLLLTISILISNRPDTVKKCLDSVQPLLRAVPSELILTDTGCGPKVRSIIEEYTDKIIDFEWCDDFSKARNVGLERAAGEWFMFLDDDEWFENVDEIIDFFHSGEYRDYGICGYYQRNYRDYEGTVYSQQAVGRMIRLKPGVRFIYSIHECFDPVSGKVKIFHSYVHHYGYVFRNDEERRAHTRRNLVLLLKEYEKNPGNMKHALQIAQEYCTIEDYEKSMEFSEEGIATSKKGAVEQEFCLPSLFVNAVWCDFARNRWEEAIRAGEKYLREEPLDPLARAYIAGYLADAWMQLGRGDKCMSYTALYWDGYQAQIKEENIYLPYITSVTSECFEPGMRCKTLGTGVRAAIGAGVYRLAEKWFSGMDWKGMQLYADMKMVEDVVQAFGTAGEKEYPVYLRMCNTMLEREEFTVPIRTDIETLIAEAGSSTDRQARIRRFAALQSDNWYFDLLKAAGEAPGQGKTAEKCWMNVWDHLEESLPFIEKYEIWKAGKRQGVSFEKLFAQLPLYRWRIVAADYCRAEEWERVQHLQTAMQEMLDGDSWYRMIWEESCLAVRLTRQENAEAETLYAYGDVIRRQAELLYRPELLESVSARTVLPVSVQAAYEIGELERLTESGEYKTAVRTVRNAWELMPEFAKCWKSCLEQLEKRAAARKEEQQKAMDEFTVLAAEVKSKARQCMQEGDMSTAETILRSLRAMMPEDAEVQGLLEKISTKVIAEDSDINNKQIQGNHSQGIEARGC